MSHDRRQIPKVAAIPCPEPTCGGRLTLGFVSEVWRERQREAGRTPSNYAFYCSNRRTGCKSLLMADDHGHPLGKPITKEVKELRNECHEAFDRIWRSAGSVPKFKQQFNRTGATENLTQHRRSILTKLRRVSYFYMAHHMCLPEPAVHLSVMTDPRELQLFKTLARRTTAQAVIEWWESRGEALYRGEMHDIIRAARQHRRNKGAPK